MTVRDLLLHTSGLNARTSDIYRREQVRSRTITMAQFIANLVRVPLMEDPGTRYRYSEGTTVLGRLVEIWSAKPFEVFLDARIFRPLGMASTMFWAATPSSARGSQPCTRPCREAVSRQTDTETLPFTDRPALIEGAVGLLSTVPDYLRFGQMLLNKGELDGVRILSAKTVETIAERTIQCRAGDAGRITGVGTGERSGRAEFRRRENLRMPESMMGWHRRHDLLGRSRQRSDHGADDAKRCRRTPTGSGRVQGHGPAGDCRLMNRGSSQHGGTETRRYTEFLHFSVGGVSSSVRRASTSMRCSAPPC